MGTISPNDLLNYQHNNPYYIYCPPFKLHSAGITVLHRLCHMLNLLGYPAFLVADRKLQASLGYGLFATNASLITPELTDEVAKLHHANGLTPIVVYPDTCAGHPLKHGIVCRYFLNYPGALGVHVVSGEDEIQFSYSQNIALATRSHSNVLFLPASDPSVFYPPAGTANRTGSCYYAAKYKSVYGGSIAEAVPADSYEITRDLPDSLSKDGLRSLFQTKKYFYCFENSALAIEAALCGCIVIFVPNESLTELIADKELGRDAFAWGADAQEIKRVEMSVALFRKRYLDLVERASDQLRHFIDCTQVRASANHYAEIINLNVIVHAVGPELSIFSAVKILKKGAWFARHFSWRLGMKKFILKTAAFIGMDQYLRLAKAKIVYWMGGPAAGNLRKLPKQRAQKI